MIRVLAVGLTLLGLSLVASSPALASDPGSTAAVKKCKWKKKRIVKKVRRHGKIKKVVRIRKRRVCAPIRLAAPSRLGVRAFEFGFTLSRQSVKAGDTVIELSNRGEDEHNLRVQRLDGGPEYAIGDTAPSSYERLRFDMRPGTYRLWCSLPEHAERGMDATVEVIPG